jgi:hypothetical protein
MPGGEVRAGRSISTAKELWKYGWGALLDVVRPVLALARGRGDRSMDAFNAGADVRARSAPLR